MCCDPSVVASRFRRVAYLVALPSRNRSLRIKNRSGIDHLLNAVSPEYAPAMESMIPRRYTTDDLERIHIAAGTFGSFDAVSDFSPGPWWGFNGILTLAIQNESLYVVRQPWPQGGPGARLLRTIPLEDVEIVKRRRSTRFGLHISARVAVRGGRSMLLSTRYNDGDAFLDLLPSP